MTSKTKKSLVVFEINDTERKGELHGYGYASIFADFIESLGFNVDRTNIGVLSSIKIDDVSFEINTDNASYMSKNAWSKDINVRKDINRFISLEIGDNRPKVVKIFFNKEYDGNKIRSKINEVIDTCKKTISDRENRKKTDKDNTIKVYSILDTNIPAIVKGIRIDLGTIDFTMEDARLSIDSSGNFLNLITYNNVHNSLEEVSDSINKKAKIYEICKEVLMAFQKCKFDDSLIEWINTSSNHHYNLHTKEYS
jgi:5S rRNA maturation endonuclease (ribonuclease M5)